MSRPRTTPRPLKAGPKAEHSTTAPRSGPGTAGQTAKRPAPAIGSRIGKAGRIAGRILAAPLLIMIWIYQHCISPFTPPSCRYTPTCSQYAVEAIRRYGPIKGVWLTLKRLSRCHPWGGSGYDPVP